MCRADHPHNQSVIVNLIDDPIAADTDPSFVRRVLQLHRSAGPWVFCQAHDGTVDSREYVARELGEVTHCRRIDVYPVRHPL
ncbi:MAG TPA: hypothetical protein VJQ83_08710, partial [Tepidiformaceae bacterium]|nr:hypothetical protein [Tepidiformaceae bacterium]